MLATIRYSVSSRAAHASGESWARAGADTSDSIESINSFFIRRSPPCERSLLPDGRHVVRKSDLEGTLSDLRHLKDIAAAPAALRAGNAAAAAATATRQAATPASV